MPDGDELPRPGELASDSSPAAASRTADYAALEAIFGVGMVGLIALTSRRERDGGHPISPEELVLLALSTFTLADVLAKERISTSLREPFVEEGTDHKPVRPEGSGMRYAVGELLTCTRCVGAWSAMGLIALRTASPTAGRATIRVLALAGLNDFLQSAFRLLAERTNRAAVETEAARRALLRGPTRSQRWPSRRPPAAAPASAAAR